MNITNAIIGFLNEHYWSLWAFGALWLLVRFAGVMMMARTVRR